MTKKIVRVMKLTAIFLFVVCLHVAARTTAQTVTLSVKNAPMKQVFRKIQKQTGMNILVEESVLENATKITLQVRNMPVNEVLDLCFKDEPLSFTITGGAIIVKEKPVETNVLRNFFPPPPIDVHGKVVNEKGESIAGVTVTVKGTKNATSTDVNGVFGIKNIDENATLIFTSTDMETFELKVNGKTELAINLKTKVTELSDVGVTVNTGYQHIPKERATGSFVQINNDLFNRQVSTDILSRLEAVANGVMVDKGTVGGITIRGTSTIQGPKDVLIVLDNFPYEGDLDNINPNDVESITILKDAAAASIWGAKAGNGVIVITTKKGKLNQRVTAELNTNLTFSNKPDLSNIRLMTSSDFIDVEKFLYSKGYYNSQINSQNVPVLSPVVELLIKRASASPTEALVIDSEIDALRNADIRDEFNRHLYQRSFKRQYSLNLRGGTEKMAWTASAGHDLNTDNLDAGFNRLNLRFQNTFKPFKRLELTSGIYYTQTASTSGKPGYGDVGSKYSNIYPYARFADEKGNSLALPKTWRQSYVDTVGNGRLLDWKYYPLEDYKHSTTTTTVTDILVNAGVKYTILEGLTADLKYTYERQTSGTRALNDEQSYNARDMINHFTQLSPTGIIHNVPKGGILDQTASVLQSRNFRMQLSYNRNWNKHEVAVIAGSELRTTNDLSNRARYYGYNDKNLSHGLVNLNTQYPLFISQSNSLIPDINMLYETSSNFISYFGNAAYSYLGKYSFSLSGRRDASNLFGLRTNDQWNPFWSGGLKWKLSDEKFYSSKLLPYLSLRASYGFSGNIDPSMAAATTIQYAGTSPYTASQFARFSNYYNSELRWEKCGMTNLGLDFSSKANRISGSFEYYFKKGTDLFGPDVLDYTGGIGAKITKNVASMKGQGIDIELKSLNLDKKLKWYTRFNFSSFKDEITEYFQSKVRGSDFVNTFSSRRISGLAGKPVYAIYSYRWAGLDPVTGEPRGYINKDISINYSSITGSGTAINDLIYHGPAVPTIFGSLGNTFVWKQISLDFAFVYKFGYYFRRQSIDYSNLFSNWVSHSDFEKRWQMPGDEALTSVPAFVYPTTTAKNNFYAGSEVLVQKADHIRLQYINLSYELNSSDIPALPVSNLTIYANISNLGLVWKANKQGIDPEHDNGGNNMRPSTIFAVGIRTNLK